MSLVSPQDDKFHEECGVFGIFGHPEAAAITALGLHALQHRGQEAAGIVSFDGARFHSERRLGLVGDTFSRRDVKRAVEVLRADAEIDRLRNLVFMRHIENPENIARQASLQVIFMTQSLERAGDHVKNLAEEICHLVSGHTLRLGGFLTPVG